MADERKSRRRPRPPQEEGADPQTDRHAAAPIQDELKRRGLKDLDDTGEEEPTSEDQALVFGADQPPADDAGPTFVGALPPEDEAGQNPADGEKTEILPIGTPDAPGAEFPVLTVETDQSTSEVDVVRDRFVIGRSPECDVVIADQLVSRQHAVIEKRGNRWFVVDQKSGNGTYLNDDRIQEAPLGDGDVIYIGDAAVTFTAPGAPAEPAADGGRPPLDKTTLLPLADAGGTSVTAAKAGPLRKRRRFLIIAGSIVVLIGILGIVKQLTREPAPEGPTPEEIAARQQRERIREAEELFAKVKELAKQEKWSQALPVLEKVAVEIGERREVRDYQAFLQREVEAEQAILDAKSKMALEDFDAAMAALNRVSDKSTKAELVGALKEQIDRRRLSTKLEQASKAMDEKDFPRALELADEVLAAVPDDQAAADLKRRAEEKIAEEEKKAPGPPHGKRKRRKRVTPRPAPAKSPYYLEAASLAAYRAGDIDEALAKADTSGVDAEGVDRLKNFKAGFDYCSKLARNPGQAPKAQKCLEGALRADKKLGGGKGKYTNQLKSMLGKVHFVQGVDCQTRNKYPEAYTHFKQAMKFRPDLSQAEKRLDDLEKTALKMYETAYVIKATNPYKAMEKCRTVLKMVRKDSYPYARCKKLVKKLSVPAGTRPQNDGF